MDKTSIAEWMLSRRLGPQRAAEIAGDLLEQHSPAQTNWHLLTLALGLRASECWALVLACLSVQFLQNILFSAWQLRSMARLQDEYVGWVWNLCTLLATLGLCSWLATAASAVRLGSSHPVTKVCCIDSCVLCLLSPLMLQHALRGISAALAVLIVAWLLRSAGWQATTRALTALGAVVLALYGLIHTAQFGEIRSCVVNMHTYSHGGWPAWSVYYGACAPLAIHNLLMLFLGAVAALWMLTFTESHPKVRVLTSPEGH